MGSAIEVRSPGGHAAQARPRILQVGGHANALPAFLGFELHHGDWNADCEFINPSPGETGRLALPDRTVDCVVAIDWLSGVSPSRRETSIAELCRVAREGVVLVNPFDRPEVVTAIRAINALYRAARGGDHPKLGRQIELGLPDVDIVSGWLRQFFPSVDVQSLGHIALWQTAEALAIGDERADGPPSDADIAAAATYPLIDTVTDGEPCYRTMIIATVRPSASIRTADRTLMRPPDFTAVMMHQALEAASQRRALDSLTSAITIERERERDEFRATIRSLATELRELDARAEFLARELRKRDEMIANQTLATTDATARVEDLETRLANTEPLAEAHRLFMQSRAGRVLRAYTRLKALLIGRR